MCGHILTSDDCETKILDNESNLPTIPPNNHDIVPSFLIVTVKRVEESSETDSSVDKTSHETQDAGRLIKYGLCMNIAVLGYIEDVYTIGQEAEVGGHSFISFSHKLRSESSHFCNNVRLAETLPDRKVRVFGTMRTNKGHST